MNFQEWKKTEEMIQFGDQEHCAKLAWNACKAEILKIINTTTHTSNGIKIYFGNNEGLIKKMTEQIEEL